MRHEASIWCPAKPGAPILAAIGVFGGRLDISSYARLLRIVNACPISQKRCFDDAILLDAAAPVLANGKVTFDAAKVAARRDAMVQRALAKDHAAVIVLGASHVLTDNVRGIVGQGCEYIRVTGHAVREYSGEPKK